MERKHFSITENDMKRMISECVKKLLKEEISSVDEEVIDFFAGKNRISVTDGDDYYVGEYISFDLGGDREIRINYTIDGSYHESDYVYSYNEEPQNRDYFDADFTVDSVCIYDDNTGEEECASETVCKQIEKMLYMDDDDAYTYLIHDTEDDRLAAEFGDPFDRD